MNGKTNGTPRPTLIQRGAAAVTRTIENIGDEVYGHQVDRSARAQEDRTSLQRVAYEDAAAREFLDSVMEEHTDLLTDEDEYGTEFTDVVSRAYAMKFQRGPSHSDLRHIRDFVSEWSREVGSRA